MTSLDTLPVELLYLVYGRLDPDRSSLHSLSLVNKKLRAFSVKFLFRTIIAFDREEGDLHKFGQIPDVVTQNVRHLIIENKLPFTPAQPVHDRWYHWSIEEPFRHESYFYNSSLARWKTILDPRKDDHCYDKDNEQYRDRDYETHAMEFFGDIFDGYREAYFANQPSDQLLKKRDDYYMPLATFIRNVPSLLDLTYNSLLLLPLCILDSLHAKHPTCRLHITQFKLGCFIDCNPELTAHQIKIMTSPCLCSITCSSLYTEAYPDALLDLVTGLSPSLKNIHILSFPLDAHGMRMTPRPLWQGYKLDDKSREKQIGSLTTLRLLGTEVGLWLQATDPSKLQSLDLYYYPTLDTLKLIAAHELPSLGSLGLHLVNHDSSWAKHEEFDQLTARIIGNLPQLSRLALRGDVRRVVFDQLLETKGKQLKVLYLIRHKVKSGFYRTSDVHFDEEDLKRVEESCPNLDDFYYR
jgi:hypothetical protein